MIKKKHISSKINLPFIQYQKGKIKPINEETLEIIDQYCSFFGCNKLLSSMEKLAGDRCFLHPRKESGKFFNSKL